MNNTSIRFRRLPSGLYNSFPTYRYTSTGSKIGKIVCGFFLIFSLVVSGTLFQGLGIPPLRVQEASAQLGPIPGLFGNPGSSDFLSLAVAIMPTLQGADLNVSNVAGSTNCDLLVPVTYVDGGCMSSLPLLTPFTVQPNMTQPINETAFVDYNYSQPSTLGISIGLSSDNITAGETQTVSVTVTDENSTEPISGVYVTSNITDSYGTDLSNYTGTTDDTGQTSFDYAIPADALSDYYEVTVTASADGYDDHTETTTFEVIGSDYDGFSYDNSTFDDSSSGDYNYDDGSSSSSDNNNDDYDSPTVKSVDPNDGQNDVPINTKITVTFDEKMDQDTLDDGSLDIFNQDGGIDPNVNADPSSKSVTYTLSPQLEPGTRYQAELDFNIQDDNGNYLDCSNSNDVDSSCTWQFETTGSSGSADIILSPSTGPILTPVTVTGSGFVPQSSVSITFDDATVAAATTTSSGSFSATFNVPPSSSIGDHTVKATQGSNTAFDTFKVTSLLEPIIAFDPLTGPVGTSVEIIGAGFDASSTVDISFNGTDIPTSPPVVTTSATGIFSANFTVPISSSIGLATIIATQGANSASEQFLVTGVTSSNQATAVKLSNMDSKLLDNQSDLSNITNVIANESNMTISTPRQTAQEAASDGLNQTNTSSTSESTTPSESTQEVSDKTRNDTEAITTTVVPDKEDKNGIAPGESAKQLTANQSSITDTKLSSESSDDTKIADTKLASESSDNTKISKRDLEQDRKDRELFEKYLRGDDAESKQEENARPVAVNDGAKTIENTPVTIAILSNDKDPDHDKLEIMGISPPQKGKIATNDDGSITYEPEKSWAGKEVFSYTVGDGNGGIASASVQVEVQPASVNNHEPRAIDQAISGNENTPEKIQLKAEDPDDGDKLAFKIVKEPSHGKISDFSAEKGTLTYLPEKDYQGKDGFTFRVTDGMAESKDGKITIEIKPGKDTIQEEQAQDQKQQQEQQQKQDQSQQKQSDNNNDQGKKTDGNDNQQSSSSDEDKGSQSEDQKQQDEPKDEPKSEPPKEEQSGSDGGSNNGS